jgi:chitinase
MRVNAGGALFNDSLGQAWQADKAFATGSWGYVSGVTKSSSTAVSGTVDDLLYQKYRESMTEYKFTVPNGQHQVKLRFAEFSATAAGRRVMRVTLEGAIVESALDVYALAGKAIALDRTYTATVNDGVLNIGFVKVTGNPMVSAIEVK